MNLWDQRFDFRCFKPIPINFFEGSKVLTHRPFALLLADTCSPLLIGLTSILASFISHLPQHKCILISHAPGLFILFIMSSSVSFPYLHAPFVSGVLSSRSVFSLERTLLDIISGVGKSILQEILWESMPLTRVFVK